MKIILGVEQGVVLAAFPPREGMHFVLAALVPPRGDDPLTLYASWPRCRRAFAFLGDDIAAQRPAS